MLTGTLPLKVSDLFKPIFVIKIKAQTPIKQKRFIKYFIHMSGVSL